MVTRRTFLGLLGAAGLAVCSRAQAIGEAAEEELELGGRWAGWAAVRGGEVSVLSQPLDRGPGGKLPPPYVQRSISDVQLRFASGMSAHFYHWIGSCLEHSQPAPERLASYRSTYELRWSGPYVTDLFLPALNAERHEPVELGATVHVASVERLAQHRPLHRHAGHPAVWRSQDFRFCIAGLEPLTRSVTAIAPLHFHRPLATNLPRHHVRAGAPQYPELVLSLGGADGGELLEALSKARRHGLLELTQATGKPWLGIEFHDLQPVPGGAGAVRLRYESARLRT